ncbi:MAG: hypothetical protein DLM58_18925 [Pseudonocardiales bacterium]|nr:MAG: hypothetical protein DLM58_18925 [Pseudonocardiales bacterium]
MAQRKSGPSASTKSGGSSKASPGKAGTAPKGPTKPGTKPGTAARTGTAGRAGATAKAGTAAKAGGAAKAAAKPVGRPPVKKKPGKSIVNQKQTPWGLIATTVLIVLFAAGIVIYAVANHKSGPGSDPNDPYRQPEIASAKAVSGMHYKVEPDHTHVTTTVNYDTTPPTGGNHSLNVADCTGTVYPNAIANENAVHSLEHGAVWITYKPGLAADQVSTLAKLVTGREHTLMSPYPGLKSNISLQSWNYQLFVDNASDSRIVEFVAALGNNRKTTPEFGASCANPNFKKNPSTFGNPN